MSKRAGWRLLSQAAAIEHRAGRLAGLDPGDAHGRVGFERGNGVVGQGFHAEQSGVLHMGQKQLREDPRVGRDGLVCSLVFAEDHGYSFSPVLA